MSIARGNIVFDVVCLDSGKWLVRKSEILNKNCTSILGIYPCETEKEACEKVFNLV
jgi:hypothetical protein